MFFLKHHSTLRVGLDGGGVVLGWGWGRIKLGHYRISGEAESSPLGAVHPQTTKRARRTEVENFIISFSLLLLEAFFSVAKLHDESNDKDDYDDGDSNNLEPSWILTA